MSCIKDYLGKALTYKELAELSDELGVIGWKDHTPTNSKAKKSNLELLGKHYNYSEVGTKRSKKYILHSEKQVKKPRGFGRKPSTSKPKSKKPTKTYKDYVYTRQDIDDECIKPISEEELERHEKLVNALEVNKGYSQADICAITGEKVETGGRNRTIQLSYWWQSFEFTETKQSGKPTIYTPIKIFKEPRPRINESYELTDFKEQQLEVGILFEVIDSHSQCRRVITPVEDCGHIITISAIDLYQSVGLVHEDYYTIRKNKESFVDYLPIEEQNIVYGNIETTSRNKVKGALKRLARPSILSQVAYTYMWMGTDKNWHSATDEEIVWIDKAYTETIDYINEKYKDDNIFISSKAQFYTKIPFEEVEEEKKSYFRNNVRENIPNFVYDMRAYKFIFVNKNVMRYLEEQGVPLDLLKEQKKLLTHMESKKVQDKNYVCNKPTEMNHRKQVFSDVCTGNYNISTETQVAEKLIVTRAKQSEEIKELTSYDLSSYDLILDKLFEDEDVILLDMDKAIEIKTIERERKTRLINTLDDKTYILQGEETTYKDSVRNYFGEYHNVKSINLEIQYRDELTEPIKVFVFVNYHDKHSKKLVAQFNDYATIYESYKRYLQCYFQLDKDKVKVTRGRLKPFKEVQD